MILCISKLFTNDLMMIVVIAEKALEIDSGCYFALEILASIEIQNGRVSEGIVALDKALQSVTSESDAAHVFSLREAAAIQFKAAMFLNMPIPSIAK